MARQYVIPGIFGPIYVNDTNSKDFVVDGSYVDGTSGGADAVVATLNKTLGAATLASTATATDAVAASLSKTLGSATLSSTATAADTVAASLAKTLGAATLSSTATATDSIVGSLSVTLGAATLSSTVAVTATVQPVTQPTTLGGTVSTRKRKAAGRQQPRSTPRPHPTDRPGFDTYVSLTPVEREARARALRESRDGQAKPRIPGPLEQALDLTPTERAQVTRLADRRARQQAVAAETARAQVLHSQRQAALFVLLAAA